MKFIKSDILKSMLLAFCGFSIWAFGDAIVRNVGEHPPIVIYWCMCLTSLVLLILLAPKLGGWRDTFYKPKLKMRILRGASLMVSNFLSIIAFSNLELTKAYSIVFIIPIMAKILSVIILKEKIRLRSWLISFAAFIGVLIVLRPGYVPFNIGTVAAIILPIFWALGYVMTKWIGEENQTALSMTIFSYLLGLAISSAIIGLSYNITAIPAYDLFWMFALGFCSIGGMLFVSKAYAKGPTAYVAPVHYTQILWGAGLGALFFGEYPDLFTIIGGSIIIAAGMALIYFSRESVRTVPATE